MHTVPRLLPQHGPARPLCSGVSPFLCTRRVATALRPVHATANTTNAPPAIVEQDVSWFSSEVGQKGWVRERTNILPNFLACCALEVYVGSDAPCHHSTAQVDAMELNTMDLPQLLIELGVRCETCAQHTVKAPYTHSHSYDPDRLAAALSARSIEINARAVRVTVVLSSFVTSLLQDYALGQLEHNAPLRARELRRVLSSLGPSFVKVGQALSSRPDLLPKPYLDALAELQDRLPSFPTPIAMTVIEEELGRPVSEVYSQLSPEPVAAASLGQVCMDTSRWLEIVMTFACIRCLGQVVCIDGM